MHSNSFRKVVAIYCFHLSKRFINYIIKRSLVTCTIFQRPIEYTWSILLRCLRPNLAWLSMVSESSIEPGMRPIWPAMWRSPLTWKIQTQHDIVQGKVGLSPTAQQVKKENRRCTLQCLALCSVHLVCVLYAKNPISKKYLEFTNSDFFSAVITLVCLINVQFLLNVHSGILIIES